MDATAKVFWSGRSQAIRLPKEFRFEGKEVRIGRADGKVWLDTEAEDPWAWLDRLEPMDEDAVSTALDRPGPEDLPKGPSLD